MKSKEFPMKTQSLINEFFSEKRFAFIGVSRQPKDFSRSLFREFVRRGYDVVPVNPHTTEIEGRVCFDRIQDVRPPVTAALLLLPKFLIKPAVLNCAEAGISLAWIYGISGTKEIDPAVLKTCDERGIALIPGYCPYMFMESAGWFHRLHGAAWKMIGLYPR